METTTKCEDILALIRNRNVDEMNKLECIPARMIISCLKNDLDNLEFFMSWLSLSCKYMPGAGSYHFEDIVDNKTFDIYHKYGFEPCNLFDDTISEEQWDYILSIGYVTQEQYDERAA